MDGEELTLERRLWERLLSRADAAVFEARRLHDEADRRRRGRRDAAVTVMSFSTAAAAVQFRRIAKAGLAAAPTSPDAAVTIALPDTIRGCLPLWVGWAMSLGTRDRAADEALMGTLLAPRAPVRGETDRGDPQAADGPCAEGASRRRGEPMESDDTIPAVVVGCHSRGGPEHAFRHTLQRRLLAACLADGGAAPPPGMPDWEAVVYRAVGYHLAALLGAEEVLRDCRGVEVDLARQRATLHFTRGGLAEAHPESTEYEFFFQA